MPWKEILPMDERQRFIYDYQQNLCTFTELCRHYAISRKTGYKWLARFQAEGVSGLREQSRAPHGCPHQTPTPLAQRVIRTRQRHRRWGPKKIIAYLAQHAPETDWPAPSTAGDILQRADLILPRRRRAKPESFGPPFTPMNRPNTVWATDFKGHFKTGDGLYCYPLTVEDGCSRFALAAHALPSTEHAGVVPIFEALFEQYGLPAVIHSDNGTPFASQAIRRLSRLQVWWIKLGIRPELSAPASPQHNGRLERFHRTLKAETTHPPAANLRAQQRLFDQFLTEYNQVRPHEALGQTPPATHYAPSLRPYPRCLPELTYPRHYEVRRVSRDGAFRWASADISLSHVLANEIIGLDPIATDVWTVYFGPLPLGYFDEARGQVSGTRDFYPARLSKNHAAH
jgi:putative transposase